MTGRQVLVGSAAWLMAVGSVASLSWLAIDSAGHEVARGDNAEQHPAAPAALRTTPLPGPSPSPTVPTSSPTVSTELTSAETKTAAPVRTTTRPSRSTATRRTTGTGHRTTSRSHSSYRSTTGPTRTTTTGAGRTSDPSVSDERIVIAGSDAFEQWLQSIAPDGVIRLPGLVIAVNFYPWWYGRYDQDLTAGNHDNSRYGTGVDDTATLDLAGHLASQTDRATVTTTGSVDTGTDDADQYVGWTARSLSNTAGLVWLNCHGSRIGDWNATPRDGWALRADLQGRHLEVHFHQDGQVFEVQAGCVDSRPAFRYRELDTGQEWQTSVE